MPTPNPRDIDYGTNKKIVKKELNYLGRDFRDIRENLIEFAKSYLKLKEAHMNSSVSKHAIIRVTTFSLVFCLTIL